jgi:hypothetical protein
MLTPPRDARALKLATLAPALSFASTPAPAQTNPFAAAWPETDFTRLAVDLSEVTSGGPPRDGIPPLERVVRVGDRAWPMTRLSREGTITEADVTLTWTAGQASALDTADIGDGREVGNVRVRDAQGRDVPHDIPFAFAFHAFHPDGRWMLGN